MSSFDTEMGEDVGKMVSDSEGCVVASVKENVEKIFHCKCSTSYIYV